MKITLPELSLVVLIGASGAGKSTWAKAHFKPTEVLSSDFCRGLVADNENDQTATGDAFALLHEIAAKRLARGLLTVIDATNVQMEARKPLVALARQFHVLPVAVVFDLPEALSHERNKTRPDRDFGPHVVQRQSRDLRRSLGGLQKEGFRHVFRLQSVADSDSAVIERQPLWNNKKTETGPFDIIGDVHGCYDELVELLVALGYVVDDGGENGAVTVTPPEGRKAVFLGDLVDRGPRTPDVLRLVMGMVGAGTALCVPGNHDIKLVKALRGANVTVNHGLAESLEQLATETPEFREQAAAFLDGLISHYVLDGGNLVVAHAGMKEAMQGRGSGKVRDFALFGETTGETDEFGLPGRFNWAGEYKGRAQVVYGHTPVPRAEWLNNTINIDTGCVFGGRLTALRYPERDLVSVASRAEYAVPVRPLTPAQTEGASGANAAPTRSLQHAHDDLLDIEDVLGKRGVETGLQGRVTVREENAQAALEIMSRFALNPKWLVYLPPTMSPCETAKSGDLLERPEEAFAYYRKRGFEQVVCEQKHMGSRAIVVIAKNEAVVRDRFGIENEGVGACYTRTGRAFFSDKALETQFLERVRAACESSGFWDRLETDWACLDCELMPWSFKAHELVRGQYASVGAAAARGLSAAVAVLNDAAAAYPTDDDGTPSGLALLAATYAARQHDIARYRDAYRHYCWNVAGVDDIRLAPFHLLATEGAVHADKNHLWHLETLATLCQPGEPILVATPHRVVTLGDRDSEQSAIDWWTAHTATGGEGMVVKPLNFVPRDNRGQLAQPAVKCRGREYLRLIYGPTYTEDANLDRLRQRGLSGKRSLALREFALGLEGLERFVQREPLRRVHECAFAVLALESEPVDPRL